MSIGQSFRVPRAGSKPPQHPRTASPCRSQLLSASSDRLGNHWRSLFSPPGHSFKESIVLRNGLSAQRTMLGRACRLSLLWDQIAGDFERWGFYAEGGAGGPVRQGGVFRTNCIDCLDRTNVVQGLLGRKHLEHVLGFADLLPQDMPLQAAFPAVPPSPPAPRRPHNSVPWALLGGRAGRDLQVLRGSAPVSALPLLCRSTAPPAPGQPPHCASSVLALKRCSNVSRCSTSSATSGRTTATM